MNRTRKIMLTLLATGAAGAGLLGTTPGTADAIYLHGWTDTVACDQAPAVGAVVPIKDSWNHQTSPSAWVRVNGDSLGYGTGYRSYQVQFDQARVVKVNCSGSNAAVTKVYESGEMTITNRVDWSHNNGNLPMVTNELHERVAYGDLTCNSTTCLPRSVANGG